LSLCSRAAIYIPTAQIGDEDLVSASNITQGVYSETFDFWVPGIPRIRRAGVVESGTLEEYSTGIISHLEDIGRENAPIAPPVRVSILERSVLLLLLWGESVDGGFACFAVESVIAFAFDNAEKRCLCDDEISAMELL
jgi:hypothetical protein